MKALKLLLWNLLFLTHFVNTDFSDIALSSISTSDESSEDYPEKANCMQKTVDEILEKIDEELAYFVTFAFCNLQGQLKEIILPIDQAKTALKNGLALPEQHLLIKPDLSSLRFLPWTNGIHRTAWLLCTAYKNANEEYEGDPRSILAKFDKKLIELGYDTNISIEFDFFLLQKNPAEILIPSDQSSYQDPEYNLSKQQEINLLIHALQDFKIEVEKIEHGTTNGQWHLTLKSTDVLKMADNLIACKYALQVLTKQLKQHISFMPKPFNDKNGNTMCIHYTLFDIQNGESKFYDSQDEFKLSSVAKSFLAGNVDKIIELSALAKPTVNSYKNNNPMTSLCNGWSPCNPAIFNSHLSFLDEQKQQLYLKFAMLDNTCNIYLVLAGILKSGIKGIKKSKKLEPHLEESIMSKVQKNDLKFQLWPQDLHEALMVFEKSNFAKNLLTAIEHEKYLLQKKAEWNEYTHFVTNWEIEKYL